MAVITYEGTAYDCRDSENLLSELLRQGADIPYSCRNGICQSCMLQRMGGITIPESAYAGLKETWRNEGYFLACLCPASGDMAVSRPADSSMIHRAVVVDKRFLAKDICSIRLKAEKPFEYHAGQFINIRRDDTGPMRSYSLASHPLLDTFLEIHVRRMKNGVMSNWICDEASAGHTLQFMGPHGTSYYTSGRPDQRLLLIATGTGLAPLLGIVHSALAAGHSGRIDLYHGSRHPEGLYLTDELRVLENCNDNFHYHPCLSGSPHSHGFCHGRADDIAFLANADLAGVRVFLCGAPPMVQSAKRIAYLAGASVSDIFADPFEVRELRSRPRMNPDSSPITQDQESAKV